MSSNESNLTDLNIEAFDDPPQQLGAHCTMGCQYSGEIDCCVMCWDCHIYLLWKEIGDSDTCDTE